MASIECIEYDAYRLVMMASVSVLAGFRLDRSDPENLAEVRQAL